MKKFKVVFTYEEGATVIVDAKSLEEAEKTVFDSLEYAGLENLSKRPSYDTVHRDYHVLPETEEYNI